MSVTWHREHLQHVLHSVTLVRRSLTPLSHVEPRCHFYIAKLYIAKQAPGACSALRPQLTSSNEFLVVLQKRASVLQACDAWICRSMHHSEQARSATTTVHPQNSSKRMRFSKRWVCRVSSHDERAHSYAQANKPKLVSRLPSIYAHGTAGEAAGS